MKIYDLVKPYIEDDKIKSKLKDKNESKWTELMKDKPKVFAALQRVIAKLTLKSLDGEKKTAFEQLAEKVKEAGKKLGAPLMHASYAAEQAHIKVGKKKIHVNGTKIKKHQEKWEKSSKKVDFDDFLKKELSSKDVKKLKKSEVEYFDEKKKEKCLVEFKDGKIRNDEIGFFTTGEYIYVLSLDKKHLYVTKKGTGIKHSSFFKGAPVACAGKVKFFLGRVTEFNDRSGHYKPTKDMMKDLREFLSDKDRLGKDRAHDIVKL